MVQGSEFWILGSGFRVGRRWGSGFGVDDLWVRAGAAAGAVEHREVLEVDEHIACAMSGLTADARTLIDHARVETQNHRRAPL